MAEDRATDPERWVERHGDAMFRFAMARLRDPSAAEEVVQETLMDALKMMARGGFAGRSSERTWLIGILRHKVVDHLRRARREAPSGDAADLERVESESFDRRGFWRRRPAGWGPDPASAVERDEFLGVFGCCLDAMPPSLAETFRLRELDGLTGEEVCQILEITPTNLWARLHRARLSLRRCLEDRWFRS
ncbi:MAG TPA: sigma-70 family RNA polymerase sigma factor [Isosphaeraceae bacterium]|jgi:RNA polymerase sigma-70 factor (ECF subfamily)|nr:sigma-70 family RNA polymerase sigma factor [Isosphaeraceae bacterium]